MRDPVESLGKQSPRGPETWVHSLMERRSQQPRPRLPLVLQIPVECAGISTAVKESGG